MIKSSHPIRRIRDVRGRLRAYAEQGLQLGRALAARGDATALQTETSAQIEQELPPVVSRLVIEIRSDGSRTLARGALEDVERGERVAIHAEGATPAELVGSLAKALLKAPWLALQATRASRERRLHSEQLPRAYDREPAKGPRKPDTE